MWSATIVVAGQPDVHESQASRDGVVEYALRYVPDEWRADVAKQLASKWLWLLPTRLATWPGGSVKVEPGDIFAGGA